MGIGAASFHMEPMGESLKTFFHDTRGGGFEVGPAYAIEKPRRDVNYAVSPTYDFSQIGTAEFSALVMAKKKRDGYAPLQEGILELPNVSLKEGLRQAEAYAAEMKKLFGFKCIGIAVHYDEGHLEPDGTRHVHRHAHIVFDRRLDNGKMHNLKRTDYRQMQTVAAAVTGLPRGEDARDTHGTTLHHMEYRRQKKAEAEARAKQHTELEKRFALEREEFRARIEKLDGALAAKDLEIIQLTRIATPAEIEAFKKENAQLKKQLDATQKDLDTAKIYFRDVSVELENVKVDNDTLREDNATLKEEKAELWGIGLENTYELLRHRMKELGKLNPDKRCKQSDYAEAKKQYENNDFKWLQERSEKFDAACKEINPDYDIDRSNQPDKAPENTQKRRGR